MSKVNTVDWAALAPFKEYKSNVELVVTHTLTEKTLTVAEVRFELPHTPIRRLSRVVADNINEAIEQALTQAELTLLALRDTRVDTRSIEYVKSMADNWKKHTQR